MFQDRQSNKQLQVGNGCKGFTSMYVGDTSRMAKDVHEALVTMAEKHGNQSRRTSYEQYSNDLHVKRNVTKGMCTNEQASNGAEEVLRSSTGTFGWQWTPGSVKVKSSRWLLRNDPSRPYPLVVLPRITFNWSVSTVCTSKMTVIFVTNVPSKVRTFT